MKTKTNKKGIPLEMNWAFAAKVIAAVIESGASAEGKRTAIDTLFDMARVADMKVDHVRFPVIQTFNFVDEVVSSMAFIDPASPITFSGDTAVKLRELIARAKGEK